MDIAPLLEELYGRIAPLARGPSTASRSNDSPRRPPSDANPIAWLIWHMARVQDQAVADLLGEQQLWVTGTWAPRFGLEPDPSNSGYGHTAEQVRSVRPTGSDALLDYLDAVLARTCSMLATLRADDLDRIVDTNFDPPVTMGVRLVSVADDALQHAGQAAYVRGLLGA